MRAACAHTRTRAGLSCQVVHEKVNHVRDKEDIAERSHLDAEKKKLGGVCMLIT